MTAFARLWRRLSTPDLITATSSWSCYRLICSDIYNAQRCGSSGFSNTSLRPHQRRSRYSSLTAFIPERVDFKIAVMTFRVLHGLAPPYLDQLVRVADLPSRGRLRSSSSYQLHVPTYNRRPSFISGCCISPLELITVQSSASVAVFRHGLKTFLFRESFPDLLH